MIEARNIGVAIGGRALLADVSVRLAAGSLTAVLGPNGAGKTTLLRVLAGDRRPDAGEALLDGRPIGASTMLGLARRRAVLSQQHAVAFGPTVAEVVQLGRLPHRGTPMARDAPAALDAVAEEFGLRAMWHRRYATLSGGEQQRTQLARAAAQLWRRGGDREGQALFLDEPGTALDLAQQSRALNFASRMAARGAAVMAILHDPNQAMRADQVVLLHAGRLIAAGPPGEVLTPACLGRCFGVEIEAIPRPGGGFLFAARDDSRLPGPDGA